MKYRAVAKHLKASCSRSELAEFFIAPVLHPDLVLDLVIEQTKRAHIDKDPFETLPGLDFGDNHASSRPGRPRARRGFAPRNLKKIIFRNLLLLCFFMFLSCAIAPNQRLAEAAPEVKPELPVPASLFVDPEQNVETLDTALRSMYYMARGILTDRPVPEWLHTSVGARLINGDWSGVVLISPTGELRGVGWDNTTAMVDNFIDRSHELVEENFMLHEAMVEMRKVQDANKIYLEIDQAATRLYVKMGANILYDFPIVCGKGYQPRERGRSARFATPRGILHVVTKEINPVWRPPAWHWTERGESPPAYRPGIPGMLGKYRLNLGNGYGIHGTRGGGIAPGRYSHGCIRMNARDLAIVFKLCDVGTPVFIY